MANALLEGLRELVNDVIFEPVREEIMLDNQSNITIAQLGGSWRSRYYARRAERLIERNLVTASYCETKVMLADIFTKQTGRPELAFFRSCLEQGKYPPE